MVIPVNTAGNEVAITDTSGVQVSFFLCAVLIVFGRFLTTRASFCAASATRKQKMVS